MIALIAGVIIGYWLYPLRMAFKLYKIGKKVRQLELDHMKLMNDLHGSQWNEDNL
jgi:uncharacterized membrane-anchored protein YhcB (DUF1043 family)